MPAMFQQLLFYQNLSKSTDLWLRCHLNHPVMDRILPLTRCYCVAPRPLGIGGGHRDGRATGSHAGHRDLASVDLHRHHPRRIRLRRIGERIPVRIREDSRDSSLLLTAQSSSPRSVHPARSSSKTPSTTVFWRRSRSSCSSSKRTKAGRLWRSPAPHHRRIGHQSARSLRRRNVDAGLRSWSDRRSVGGTGPWQASTDARWEPEKRDTSLRRP